MFAKLIAVASVAFVAVASSTPGNSSAGGSGAPCTSGNPQCCEMVYTPTDPEYGFLLGFVNVVVDDVVGNIASGCQNLDINALGSTCSSNSVCCQDTSNTLVSVSCLTL